MLVQLQTAWTFSFEEAVDETLGTCQQRRRGDRRVFDSDTVGRDRDVRSGLAWSDTAFGGVCVVVEDEVVGVGLFDGVDDVLDVDDARGRNLDGADEKRKEIVKATVGEFVETVDPVTRRSHRYCLRSSGSIETETRYSKYGVVKLPCPAEGPDLESWRRRKPNECLRAEKRVSRSSDNSGSAMRPIKASVAGDFWSGSRWP